MYKIIGADWKEYGPISTDTVRQWIKEGRASPQTRIQAEGSQAWKLLSECPEWADVLPPPTPLPPTGFPSAPTPLALPQLTRRCHGLAIAGLVLGLLGLVQCCGPLTGILGLVLSLAAWVQINQEPERYKGKELAVAGLVFAVLGFLITGILYWYGAGQYLEKLLRDLTR